MAPVQVKPQKGTPVPESIAVVSTAVKSISLLKLSAYSLIGSMDHPNTMTFVDNMVPIDSRKFLGTLMNNQAVNVIRYQAEHDLCKELTAGLQFALRTKLKYACVFSEGIMVETPWASRFYQRMENEPGLGAIECRPDCDRDKGFANMIFLRVDLLGDDLKFDEKIMDRVRGKGFRTELDDSIVIHKLNGRAK